MADFDFERSYAERGCRLIAGVDEVGRGALCGPVVAAAVVLPPGWIRGEGPDWLADIRDSKLLVPKKRLELARLILESAEAVGIGACPSTEIDRRNIYWASLEAMRRAVDALSPRPDAVLVDGFELRGAPFLQRGIPQGDKKSYSIAAASIVAKVRRDELMVRFDRIAPGYGLSRNKGYGTAEHYRALERLGPTAFHRKSFKLQAERKLF